MPPFIRKILSNLLTLWKVIRTPVSWVVKVGFIVSAFLLLFRPETFGFPEDQFQNVSFGSLLETLRGLGFGHAIFWFSFAAIVKLAGIFCGVLRWHFLLKGQGVRLPFWYLAKCWFMGRAIGLFLPGTVGLDGYRLIESAAYTGEAIKCTTVIAVEKLIGFVALGLLVFLTLPLGARLFDFNIVLLAIVLGILFTFIATAFLLLLNPRIVQVIVACVPVPNSLRHKVNTLGAAVTAYSAHRGTLFLAVLLGLGVHLGICLMYFGVAMAVSGGEVGLF
ncbi:MAG: flippase-like domain-containing protein, partial [Candidatus Hydrogenedentes bacterium]|nr:flippase-like domain-containing protein [Candidatus Hydrogenedentota bacterium]